MPIELEAQIESALKEIVIARDAAAAPLKFSSDAAALSDEMSRGQFRASLPLVSGGFTSSVREGLLAASALFGSVAKSLAQFQDIRATEINKEQMQLARAVAERACKLKLAEVKQKHPDTVDVSDGLLCG
jgi:hypothetical protein